MNLDTLVQLGLTYLPFLFSITFHEFSHALVAKKFGDDTAEEEGRLTMNPFVHMDFFGTFLFPVIALSAPGGFFFGWAKPVPVNPRNLSDPKNGMFWVAFAGPLSNFILAIISAVVLGVFSGYAPLTEVNQGLLRGMQFMIMINIFLGVFNLLPIHPLDGGKVLERFLPYQANIWLINNSRTIGISILAIFILSSLGGIFSLPMQILIIPVQFLNSMLINLASVISTLL